MNESVLTPEEKGAILAILRHRDPEGRRLCSKCGEDKEHRMDFSNAMTYDRPTVKCLECNNVMSFVCQNANKAIYRRLHDLEDLRRGDEIAWHRPVCHCPPTIWHHAVVIEEPGEGRSQVEVIHYTTTDERGCCGCPAVQETEQSVTIDVEDEVFVIDYPESYAKEYVIKRAEYRLANHERYCFCLKNCEHFAGWAKTGKSQSKQMKFCHKIFRQMAYLYASRFVAIAIVMMLIEKLIPDQDANGRTIESLTSFIVGGAWVLHFVGKAVYKRCLQTKDTYLESRFSSRYGSEEKRGGFSRNNAGLVAEVTVELAIALGMPLAAVALLQKFYTGSKAATYVLIVFIFTIGPIVSYVLGRVFGRFFKRCSCRR